MDEYTWARNIGREPTHRTRTPSKWGDQRFRFLQQEGPSRTLASSNTKTLDQWSFQVPGTIWKFYSRVLDCLPVTAKCTNVNWEVWLTLLSLPLQQWSFHHLRETCILLGCLETRRNCSGKGRWTNTLRYWKWRLPDHPNDDCNASE